MVFYSHDVYEYTSIIYAKIDEENNEYKPIAIIKSTGSERVYIGTVFFFVFIFYHHSWFI